MRVQAVARMPPNGDSTLKRFANTPGKQLSVRTAMHDIDEVAIQDVITGTSGLHSAQHNYFGYAPNSKCLREARNIPVCDCFCQKFKDVPVPCFDRKAARIVSAVI